MLVAPSKTEVYITKREHVVVKDRSQYLPLYKAALKGDWERARRFLNQDEDALTAKITALSMTVLHVVVGTGKAIHFVENLVNLMPSEALALYDDYGNTPLNVAALVGNTEAAVILMRKNPALLYMGNNRGWLPVHRAALNAHRNTLQYFLAAHKDNMDSKSLADQSGVELLVSVIDSGFFDVAMSLVQHYPELATFKLENGNYALKAIARKASAFPSGSGLSLWQRFIYARVPIKLEDYYENLDGVDVEKLVGKSQVFVPMCGSGWLIGGCEKLLAMLWEIIKLLGKEQQFACAVPHFQCLQNMKLMHHQALHLVKSLCKEIRSLNEETAHASLYETAVLQAAELGIHEVVEEIVDAFPDAIYSSDKGDHYLFEVAVVNRCENVFNLIYQMSAYRQYVTLLIDNSGNTILHLVARLAPPHKLDLVSGAALQMQRELQWFKELEKFVIPSYKEKENSAKETPAMVFTREHKELVVRGERWIKDTSNSCMIAAALIATVVFAAAITVPGGSNSYGLPIFSNEIVFIVFAVSDAVSLFTSTTSLLMFLSILTSRYAEGDFLHVLPERLIIGLVTLFLSITTMMIAFTAAVFLVFGHKNAWVLVPVAALACLPVTSFVSLQFPLLFDVISLTYGPGLFGKQSKRPFY
ncbi:hypothetical protein RJ639_047056 [Escallonia herrerae]|uniref:PGG domain-containing protein n=1 Tax=Escallonia herrerae TaxID=1293975 RepID=A0AA88W9X0_9ASTE|nr:hypothetical protein RJ639_047056 [Escallonia herrerae]